MTNIDEKQFRTLIETYGSKPECWPAESRNEALEFAKTDMGHSIITEARILDAILDTATATAPASARFISQLHALSDRKELGWLSRASAILPDIAPWLHPRKLVAQSSALVASLLLGLWVGGQGVAAEEASIEDEIELLSMMSAEDVMTIEFEEGGDQ